MNRGALSDETMFEKKVFCFLGCTVLGQWCPCDCPGSAIVEKNWDLVEKAILG